MTPQLSITAGLLWSRRLPGSEIWWLRRTGDCPVQKLETALAKSTVIASKIQKSLHLPKIKSKLELSRVIEQLSSQLSIITSLLLIQEDSRSTVNNWRLPWIKSVRGDYPVQNLVTAVVWIQSDQLETAPVRKLETALGLSWCVVTAVSRRQQPETALSKST